MQALHGLPEQALIEMGDFAGGMLKYLRAHPVPRVTVAGGVGQDDQARPGPARPALQRGGSTSTGWPSASRRQAARLGPSRRRARPTRRWRRSAARQRRRAARRRRRGARLAHGRGALAGAGIALEMVLFDRAGAARRPRAAFAPGSRRLFAAEPARR